MSTRTSSEIKSSRETKYTGSVGRVGNVSSLIDIVSRSSGGAKGCDICIVLTNASGTEKTPLKEIHVSVEEEVGICWKLQQTTPEYLIYSCVNKYEASFVAASLHYVAQQLGVQRNACTHMRTSPINFV
jgi:hypothetical protein